MNANRQRTVSLYALLLGPALLGPACGGMDQSWSQDESEVLAAGDETALQPAFCDQLSDTGEPMTLEAMNDYHCDVCRMGSACGFTADEVSKACALCPELEEGQDGQDQEDQAADTGLAPRALVSGVPRYYQTDLDHYLPGDQCGGKPFLSGCGPVAGATIVAWWDRRGFDSLIDDGDVTADGLPEQAIFDLGRAGYMDRLSFCGKGTAVEPYLFLDGLRDFMDDRYLGTDFVVTKYKITKNLAGQVCYKKKVAGQSEQSCNTDLDRLRHLVKQQINKGQPMVLLLRAGGETNPDGTFKFANHYATVVGYDHRGADLELVTQYNHGYGYQNLYSTTGAPIVLGDHTRRSAAVKFNLYTIEPGESAGQDYLDACQGLLTTGTRYHIPPHDGVATSDFEPDCDVWTGSVWGGTTRLHHQDDICLVARWR